jgi:hypothetical protein
MDVRRRRPGGKACHDRAVDRETLADVAHLVGHLDGFEAVYLVDQTPFVVITDDIARARAAARLTVLGGIHVNIVSATSSLRRAVEVAFSPDELAAAVERDQKRRAAWATYRLDVDTGGLDLARARNLFVVSTAPKEHAAILRERASAPLKTYGTSDPACVVDMLAVYALPHVVLLDANLEGTDALARRISEIYPGRFSAFGSVQWMSSKKGLRDDDVERILGALGMRSLPTLEHAKIFSHTRVLVVDTHDSTLAREVETAMPGANVEHASGWEAIDRLGEGDLDLVVAANAEDVSLPALVRFVRRCKIVAPMLVIASDEPRSSRMRSAYPQLAHYFVPRPVCTDDLLRVLKAR